MSKLFIIILAGLLIGCGNNKTTEVKTEVVKQDVSLIEKSDLEKLDFTEFVLDAHSKRKISGWLKYDELQEKITELKKADLSYFKSDKKVVETLIAEFATTLPENVNTNDINARVLIVKNMYLKLNNIINLSTSTKEDLKKSIQDLLEAFSNLNFQINKKFEKDSQNITKP